VKRVQLVIRGHHFPGRSFTGGDADRTNVHVGVQERREPVDLVGGDVEEATWKVEVRVVRGDDGTCDFKGASVQGKKGDRFLYLTWGDVGTHGSFAMFRRAKLMVADIAPALLADVAQTDGVLVASLPLTDERGCPRCARVKPPVISWRAG